MMGHRTRLISGSEFDALCRKAKRWRRWRAGVRKAIKRKHNRRQRHGNALLSDRERTTDCLYSLHLP